MAAAPSSRLPRTFRSAAAFRAWLQQSHRTSSELVVRCFRVEASARGITYIEALHEALCFGWIDGVRRSHDEVSFTVRFTPRRRGSIWSRVNVAKVEKLIEEGRMAPAGLAAFEAREASRTAAVFLRAGGDAAGPGACEAVSRSSMGRGSTSRGGRLATSGRASTG